MPQKFVRGVAALLLFCFLPSVIYSGELSEDDKKTAGTGHLILTTKHCGLGVKIDGKFYGFTPVDILQLPAGPHQISVTHPRRSNWLDRDWFSDAEITAGDTLYVHLIFNRSFSINSTPFDVPMFLNKVEIGKTPLFFELPEDQTGEILLSKEGFQDTTFQVGSTHKQFFNIVMQPDKSFTDFDLQSENAEFARHSKTKLYMFSAIGLSLVSGALALYFQEKGNDSYNQYLRTGDPNLSNQYFDNAKKYDRYAAISFGAFQVSFVISSYLFLKGKSR